MAKSNEVIYRFRNSIFADAFQKWVITCAKESKMNIHMFFEKTGDNEWYYEEDDTALPSDHWMPGPE